MGTHYVRTNTAETVSGVFTLERSDQGLIVEVPSRTGGAAIGIQFTKTGSPAWFPLMRSDGSGLPFLVSSGPGPSYTFIDQPPPATRATLTVNAINFVTSYTIFTIRR